jgi:hypothetical protein
MVKVLALLLVALPYGCASKPGAAPAPAHTEAVAQQAPAAPHEDPEVLIRHCGRPDNVADSQWYQPGVTIPSRTLTYSKAHLSITYVSAGQANPTGWNLSSVVDTETNRALDTTDLHSILEKRLPCAVAGAMKEKHEGSRTQETGVRSPKPEGRNQVAEDDNG